MRVSTPTAKRLRFDDMQRGGWLYDGWLLASLGRRRIAFDVCVDAGSERNYRVGLADFGDAIWLAQPAFDQRKAPAEWPVALGCWQPTLHWKWEWVVGSVWRVECRQRLLAQV